MRVPRQFARGRAARRLPLEGRMPCVVSMLQVRLRFCTHVIRWPLAFLLPLLPCGLLLSLVFVTPEPLSRLSSVGPFALLFCSFPCLQVSAMSMTKEQWERHLTARR